MATAKREEVIVKSDKVTLSLSEEEAKTLLALLAKIGGKGEVRNILSGDGNSHGSIYGALLSEVGSWTLSGVEVDDVARLSENVRVVEWF